MFQVKVIVQVGLGIRECGMNFLGDFVGFFLNSSHSSMDTFNHVIVLFYPRLFAMYVTDLIVSLGSWICSLLLFYLL